MRCFALICALSFPVNLRSISHKPRKSGQVADACSSQMVVKIGGFTTKDFAGDFIIAYFSGFA